MKVALLHFTPLPVGVFAIRKCYRSEERSDTTRDTDDKMSVGPKDKSLIERIIASGHMRTMEHVCYTFDVQGPSRKILQMVARHRVGSSLSVESTRYTLRRLLGGQVDVSMHLTPSGDSEVDELNRRHLEGVVELMARRPELKNDVLSYLLPEAYRTSFIWTLNVRSLSHFLALRLSSKAHPEIQALARAVALAVPPSHGFLFDAAVRAAKAGESWDGLAA